MTGRRPLAETLAEIAEGAMAAAGAGVRATRIEVALPVEIAMAHDGTLAGDLPRAVTRTAFDAPPSRLSVVWEVAP